MFVRRFRGFVQLVVVAIGVALLATLMPVPVQAAPPGPGDESVVLKDAPERARIVGEVVGRRTDSSKTFRMSDGTFRVAVYPGAVHVRDQAGVFQDIVNSVVLADGGRSGGPARVYETPDKRVRFSPQAGSLSSADVELLSSRGGARVASDALLGTVGLSVGNEVVSWGYDGIAPAVVQWDRREDSLTGDERFLALTGLVSSGVYRNAFASSDLQYVVAPGGVKENIVLQDRSAQSQWTIRFSVGGLRPVQTDGHTIRLYGDDDALRLVISAPLMVDASGKQSDGVSMAMTVAGGLMTVALSADRRFLDARSTEYPVVVDPTFTIPGNLSYSDTFISSWTPTVNYGLDQYTYAGFDSATHGIVRALVRVESLPVLPAGSVITEASLGEYGCGLGPAGPITVEAHRVTGAWSETGATWNNSNTLFDANVEDYVAMNVGESVSWRSWDLTRLVKLWYEKPASYPNYGVALMAPQAESDQTNGRKVFLYSSNNAAAPGLRPYFQISYRNNSGLEGYWTFHSQSVNGATGYVNDYSGNLVSSVPVAATSGLAMPISVDLVYNGNSSDQQYRNNTNGSVAGMGWMTSLGQRLEHVTTMAEYAGVASDLVAGDLDYVWLDPDGTHHFFKWDSAGTYVDEDGLGLTLRLNQVFDGSSGWNIIEDLGGNKTVFQSNGYFRAAVNNLGQRINLSYNGANLASVTDGAGRQLSFSYSGSTITAISSPDGTVSLGYTGANLSSVSYPDGTKVSFTYSPVTVNGKMFNRLATMTGRDGIGLAYGYAASGTQQQQNRVATVTERAADGATGNQVSIDYSKQNETKFTYTQTSGTVYETYQFDHWGHTLNVLDGDGSSTTSANAGSSNATYTPNVSSGSGFSKNNRITKASAGSRYVYNMLTNHGVEGTLSGWSSSKGGATNAVNSVSTTEKFLGNQSLSSTQTDTPAVRSGWSQTSVPVQASTSYTLSAYVKTSGVTSANVGNGASVWVVELAGAATVKTTDSDTQLLGTQDWQRVSVTFTTGPTTTTANVWVGLNYAIGTAWFDAMQLELADTASPYNLLENSDFGRTGSWGLTNPATGDGISGGSVRLSGTPGVNRNVLQSILIGKPGLGFYVSGRASATAAPLSGASRNFGLNVGIFYSDSTPTEWTLIPFNPDVSTWQFTSGMAAPSEANRSKIIHHICVYLLYDSQVNTALFDDTMVTLDETGASYTYDSKGNVSKILDNSSQSETVQYSNATNQVTGLTTSDGEGFSYNYDSANPYLLVSSKDNLTGMGSEYTHGTGNNAANVTMTRTGKVGSMTANPYIQTGAQYSSNGAYTTAELDERGLQTTYTVDSSTGRVSAVKDPNNVTTIYAYDPTKKTLTSISTGPSSVSYGYDTASLGNRLNQITHNGFSYNLAYDKWANLQSISVGTQSLLSNTFAAGNGYLTRTTFGNSQYLDYTYDPYDRVTALKANGVQTAGFTYDANGRLVRVTDNKNGGTLSYGYSNTGALLDVSTPQGRIGYGSNRDGTMNHKSVSMSGTTLNTVYSYLIDDRPDTTTYPSGATLSHNYDSLKRLQSERLSPTAGGTALSREVTYWDAGNPNRTTSLILSYDNYLQYSNGTKTPVPGWTRTRYQYDDVGNVAVRAQDHNLGNTTVTYYAYDSLNQLVRVDDQTNPKTFTYAYDTAGNITAKTEYWYTTGTLGAPVKTNTYTYADPAWKDKLTAYNGQSITYDAIGNPLQYRNGMTFQWQMGRQLATAKTPTGQTVGYTYNPQGIRTGKTIGETTTSYLVDGQGVIQAMQRGNDKLVFMYDSTGHREGFMWYTGATFNGSYYYLYNAQTDVIGIVNSSLTPVAYYQYDPWGNPTKFTDANGADISAATNHIANINPFRYRSYTYDQETGLYYLNSRYYDPETGRFINADVIDVLAFGANLFAYCHNNPVNSADTTGHFAGALTLTAGTTASLGGALAGIMTSISASMAGIKAAIATAWLPAVCIAATAIAIAGIVYAVSKIVSLSAAATTTVAAVIAKVRLKGIDPLKLSKETVYVIVRNGTTDVEYVGRTNNFKARQAAHQGGSKPKFPKDSYTMLPIATGLSWGEARALEQSIISAYGIDTLKNMINSISPTRWGTFKVEFNQMKHLIEAFFDPE